MNNGIQMGVYTQHNRVCFLILPIESLRLTLYHTLANVHPHAKATDAISKKEG